MSCPWSTTAYSVMPRSRRTSRSAATTASGAASTGSRSYMRRPRADAADAVDPVANEIAGRPRRREGGVRGHVDLREPVEQLPCVLALLDRGMGAQDGVRVQERARIARGGEREDDARVALDVPQLHVPPHVAAEQLVAVAFDPDDADLRTAVGVDRAQVGERAGVDEIAQLARKGAHLRIVAFGNRALTVDATREPASRSSATTEPCDATGHSWRPGSALPRSAARSSRACSSGTRSSRGPCRRSANRPRLRRRWSTAAASRA